MNVTFDILSVTNKNKCLTVNLIGKKDVSRLRNLVYTMPWYDTCTVASALVVEGVNRQVQKKTRHWRTNTYKGNSKNWQLFLSLRQILTIVVTTNIGQNASRTKLDYGYDKIWLRIRQKKELERILSNKYDKPLWMYDKFLVISTKFYRTLLQFRRTLLQNLSYDIFWSNGKVAYNNILITTNGLLHGVFSNA